MSERKPLRLLVLGLISTLLSLVVAEGLVRLTALDIRLVQPALYLVEDDMHYEDGAEAYQPSPRAGLLYEAIPSQTVTCAHCTHPMEDRYSSVPLSTNTLGLRGPEHGGDKPPGVRRIVVLGGSNIWAATVHNGDTPTAQTQRRLDEAAPGRFEVWNAGLNANVMSQKVARAEEFIDQYAPDLLVFQHHNQGRRAFFHGDEDPARHFTLDPDLYLENIPSLLAPGDHPAARRPRALRRSALYRAVRAAGLRIAIWRHVASCENEDPRHLGCADAITGPLNVAADALAYQRWLAFLDRNPTLPILVVDPVFEVWCPDRPPNAPGPGSDTFLSGPRPDRPNLEYVSLCWGDRPPEYRDIHPPSYVYEEYGVQLAGHVWHTLGGPAPQSPPRNPATAPQ